jgi:hypothetical protein
VKFLEILVTKLRFNFSTKESIMQAEIDFSRTPFGGYAFTEADRGRLTKAMRRVYDIMCQDPNRWFIITELASLAKVPAASLGSYLSYLRGFGFEVQKEHIDNGLYQYRLGLRVAATLPKKKKKIDCAIEFIEEITNAIGKYPYLNGQTIVADAREVLKIIDPKNYK